MKKFFDWKHEENADKNKWLIAVLAGALLLVVALPSGEKNEKNSGKGEESVTTAATDSGGTKADYYRRQLETELAQMLEEMEGVELAAQNAKLVLSQDREKLKREEGRTIGAVKEISDLLQLPLTGTARMEAYDISNINGFENVGSMVVYEKGKPKRSDYRKFKIKSVSGPDDYACMREVLTRRFRHGMEESRELEEQEMDQEYGSFTKFPDLILMDGGRGQVNIALSVLEELGIDIPVCGMVKDDNHRTRGLYYHNIELPIDTHSEGFKLITRIQDEAHRFAIEYHRSLRSKTQVRSVLDDIPGVGPARRKALMRHFKSLEEIRQATVEDLMEIPEMNERTAQEIVAFFASQKRPPVVQS